MLAPQAQNSCKTFHDQITTKNRQCLITRVNRVNSTLHLQQGRLTKHRPTLATIHLNNILLLHNKDILLLPHNKDILLLLHHNRDILHKAMLPKAMLPKAIPPQVPSQRPRQPHQAPA